MENKIAIYQSEDGLVKIDVHLEDDSVWLSQAQIVSLYQSSKANVSEHIKHIFEEGELGKNSVVRKFRTTAKDGKSYNTDYYNLDMIISLGYRIKSKIATRFRIWATSILRKHIIDGYTINKKRLDQLNKTIEIISRSYIPEISGIASILQNFAKSLNLLDNYDHQEFSKPKNKSKSKWLLTYKEARKFIDSMKFGEESSLFGREKDHSFKSSLGTIYQTFDGKELYPSIQEKAANLLYLVVKNHSFTDGNKRIAAALFVYFLDKNKALKNKNGQLLIDNNALAATTLMIALSKPQEKEIMCSLVVNFIS
ncbi:MAG: virulence RhuM family protein [Candidatus Fibromonas sp.]|jgi:prophage maintenance system killer protein|nr:virulence RhuM family protein [Candidatus Fibromonas sp.]